MAYIDFVGRRGIACYIFRCTRKRDLIPGEPSNSTTTACEPWPMPDIAHCRHTHAHFIATFLLRRLSSSLSPFFLRFCSQLARLWFAHSMKLCKTRRHRRHRIIFRFNCECSRIVCARWWLCRSAVAMLLSLYLSRRLYAFHVKLNYDIVLNGVCLCYVDNVDVVVASTTFYLVVVCVCRRRLRARPFYQSSARKTIFFAFRPGFAATINPEHTFMVPKEASHTHCPNSNANAMSLAVLNSNISSYFIFLPFGRRSQCFLILVSFHELNCACRDEKWVRLSYSAHSMNPRFETHFEHNFQHPNCTQSPTPTFTASKWDRLNVRAAFVVAKYERRRRRIYCWCAFNFRWAIALHYIDFMALTRVLHVNMCYCVPSGPPPSSKDFHHSKTVDN